MVCIGSEPKKHAWKPTAVIFCRADGTNTIGVAGDTLGSYGATHLQVLDTAVSIPCEDLDGPHGGGLSNLEAPSTPNPFNVEDPPYSRLVGGGDCLSCSMGPIATAFRPGWSQLAVTRTFVTRTMQSLKA